MCAEGWEDGPHCALGSPVQSAGIVWEHLTSGQGMTHLAPLLCGIPATPYSTPWGISWEGGEWS